MPAMKFVVTQDDMDAAESSGSSGPQAPVDFYTAEVIANDFESPGGDKNDRYHVVYKIIDGEEEYAYLHDYLVLTEASKWKTTQYLVATGALKKAGTVTDLTKTMTGTKGKEVRLKVRGDTWNDEYRAKVGGVWPNTGKAADNGSRRKAATADPEDRLAELQAMDEAELADLEDEITDLANQAGLEADSYETWAELVEALASEDSTEDSDEDEAPGVQDPRWLELLGLDEEALAEAADELDEYNTFGIDADAYETWAEYAEAINDAMNDAEPEEDSDEAGEGEDEGEDYSSWSIPDLKTELKARELDATGTKAVLAARLVENDSEEPF